MNSLLTIQEEINGRIVTSELRKIYSDNEYYVSEYGYIYSTKHGVENYYKLKEQKNNYISLKINKKCKSIKWDKTLLNVFKPSDVEMKYARHIDGNPDNRHYSNLEWANKRPSYFTRENNRTMRVPEVITVDGETIIKDVELRYIGIDGYYVSEYGKVYSIKKNKIPTLIKIFELKSGHDKVELYPRGDKIAMETNVLTARCFIPIEKELPYVLFKDKNIENKHYTNLIWSEYPELKEDMEGFETLEGFSSYRFNKEGVGKSYRKKYPKLLKPFRNDNGYYFYSTIINDKGVAKSLIRHRIISSIFIPNPENKPYVDHINRIRGDDRIENLRWVDAAENRENCDQESISNKLRKRIGQFLPDGTFVNEYKNIYEAAGAGDHFRPTGIKRSIIKNKNIINFEECEIKYGYIWRYMNSTKIYTLLPGEIKKPIVVKDKNGEDLVTTYFITNFGTVINKRGYPLKWYLNSGYPLVNIYFNHKGKFKKIHRLVAISFIEGRTEERNVVNHKDENKLNFRYDNLEWLTTGENNEYSIKYKKINQHDMNTGEYIRTFESAKEVSISIPGYNPTVIRADCKTEFNAYGYRWKYHTGEEHIPSKIEVKIFNNGEKAVDQFRLDGSFVKRYDSIAEAIRQTGIRNMSSCCSGNRKKAGGFIWRYADTFESLKNIEPLKTKVVDQYTLAGVYVQSHMDASSAARHAGVKYNAIYQSCTGKQQTTGGFRWKYRDSE